MADMDGSLKMVFFNDHNLNVLGQSQHISNG